MEFMRSSKESLSYLHVPENLDHMKTVEFLYPILQVNHIPK